MTDTTGNGSDDPTDEEKQRVKDKVLKEFDKQQEEKNKNERKDKK